MVGAAHGGFTGAVSVNYSTGAGTAVDGEDYTAVSGTLNWADGEGGRQVHQSCRS